MICMDTHPGDRQAVLIPVELNEQFMQVVRVRSGPAGSTLLYCWLREAVNRARAGLSLPVPSPTPYQRGRRWVKARWRQSDAEYARWKAEIEAAGSSVSTVLRSSIQRYVASGGDAAAPLVA